MRIVTGKDKGRQAWHVVIVVDSKLEKIKAAHGQINAADYGHIIFSGWGEELPEETNKLLTTYGPTSGLVW